MLYSGVQYRSTKALGWTKEDGSAFGSSGGNRMVPAIFQELRHLDPEIAVYLQTLAGSCDYSVHRSEHCCVQNLAGPLFGKISMVQKRCAGVGLASACLGRIEKLISSLMTAG